MKSETPPQPPILGNSCRTYGAASHQGWLCQPELGEFASVDTASHIGGRYGDGIVVYECESAMFSMGAVGYTLPQLRPL